MNFFRALVSAFVVAVMGAIVLAGLGDTAQRGVGTAVMPTAGAGPHEAVLHVFSLVFVAAAICLVLALLAMVAMEERPLRGTVRAPAAADAPAE